MYGNQNSPRHRVSSQAPMDNWFRSAQAMRLIQAAGSQSAQIASRPDSAPISQISNNQPQHNWNLCSKGKGFQLAATERLPNWVGYYRQRGNDREYREQRALPTLRKRAHVLIPCSIDCAIALPSRAIQECSKCVLLLVRQQRPNVAGDPRKCSDDR